MSALAARHLAPKVKGSLASGRREPEHDHAAPCRVEDAQRNPSGRNSAPASGSRALMLRSTARVTARTVIGRVDGSGRSPQGR